jgi:hypothetical protein
MMHILIVLTVVVLGIAFYELYNMKKSGKNNNVGHDDDYPYEDLGW